MIDEIWVPNTIRSYSFTKIPDWVRVGNYSSIAGGCKFYGGKDNHYCADNHEAVCTNNDLPPSDRGLITIGHDVWIGEGVRIMSGVRIGNGAIIGAGSVVGKDIPQFSVVVGNPAVIKRTRFSQEIIDKLNKIQWWLWNEGVFVERLEDFKNIDTFIEKYDHTS